jgi:hypothetical protein
VEIEQGAVTQVSVMLRYKDQISFPTFMGEEQKWDDGTVNRLGYRSNLRQFGSTELFIQE